MAGAPSSKGCRGCLKQKKKCDQLKPSCSRCARLKIQCVGAGKQKYKFKAFQPGTCQDPQETYSQTLDVVGMPSKPRLTVQITLPPTPSNDSSLLAGRFVAALGAADLRYSLVCYGDFLEYIPQRLGESDALDASVKALLCALPYHYNGQMPSDALVYYIEALKALRLCLSCTDKKLVPETLSAIYMIMICQGWIGQPDDHATSHGEVLAHLASSAVVQNWKETFELRLLETLFVPLILEAMVNPAITLEPWFMLIDSYISQKTFFKSQRFHVTCLEGQHLVRMPMFFHNPLSHLAEIESTYRDMYSEQPGLSKYLAELERLMAEYQPDFPQIRWMQQAVWLKSWHRFLLGQLSGSNSSEASWDGKEPLNISMVNCKAAFGPSGSCMFA
ncbi:hypothetical protein FZEAL_3295 [Fusarium zealandicum]|uniref:Zn(2)-C6 fungal-type domain-containing protein n=1 Tax=Fusarium zealandicum TaxID=1053134 RepID=A0A8H4XN31_9HYPO|nr:hypothetical protein FZEAL_3295 [Fusarium zealandicum]